MRKYCKKKLRKNVENCGKMRKIAKDANPNPPPLHSSKNYGKVGLTGGVVLTHRGRGGGGGGGCHVLFACAVPWKALPSAQRPQGVRRGGRVHSPGAPRAHRDRVPIPPSRPLPAKTCRTDVGLKGAPRPPPPSLRTAAGPWAAAPPPPSWARARAWAWARPRRGSRTVA